eukprot:TRINITY_DN1780_c0_g3_i1.p1 TRINITY_DN1780_c0_g3~~TRINITY_DN1780_c0_g3_i1.p1  ORF type:complete len:161 (+),score=25.97 TRINITY_DN1780_c0_g3_i1:77-559(+)
MAAVIRTAATRLSTSLRTTPRLVRYHENVIDHYENPRNVGSLDKHDANVGTGLVGAAGGDVIKLQIQVNDATGEIEKAVFKTYGCESAIASSSLATEWVEGKKIDTAVIANTNIAQHLNLPRVKLHCSMLAENAIRAAIEDYTQKRDALAQTLNLLPLNQ